MASKSPQKPTAAMDENPYAPPIAISQSAAVFTGPQAAYRGVAAAQRVIIICFLVIIVCVIAARLVPLLIATCLGYTVLLVLLVILVAVFFLSIKLLGKLWNVGLGILIVMLALVPPFAILGLLLMTLLVNVKATMALKANGYEVGFFGATPSEFQAHSPVQSTIDL
jgi:hypothetical protein